MRKFTRPMTVLMVAALAACASVDAPVQLQARAQANLEQARTSGAREHAPVLLRDAETNLEEANRALSKGDNKEAKRYLEKAIADADLAIATTNAERSLVAAREIRENLQALQQEVAP